LETHNAAETSVSVLVTTTEYARRPETASVPLSETEAFLYFLFQPQKSGRWTRRNETTWRTGECSRIMLRRKM